MQIFLKEHLQGFPGDAVVENPPANAGDTGSIPDPGRSHMRRVTKPVCHKYWACALEPASHNYLAHVPQLLKLARLEPAFRNEKPPQWEAREPQWRVAPTRRNQRKARAQKWRPNAARNNK